MKVGYARGSSAGQKLDIQIEKLEAAGCEKIFTEKKSGASKEGRETLREALAFLREGDELTVTRLDRLARSLSDLAAITKQLEAKGVAFTVLDQNIETQSPTGRLLFHVLGAIAEFERGLINERVAEGIAKAKASGVKFGPKEKLTPAQKQALKEEFEKTPPEGRKALADKWGISRSSLYRITSVYI